MALSNIRKEPRREITESFLGILSVILALVLDYLLSHWLHVKDTHFHPTDPAPIYVLMIFVPLGCMVTYFLLKLILYVTHSLGESVCGWLADMGIDPRPKNRYR